MIHGFKLPMGYAGIFFTVLCFFLWAGPTFSAQFPEKIVLGVFSEYDYAVFRGKERGNSVVLKNILKNNFRIETDIKIFKDHTEAKNALLSGDIQMVFGLRPGPPPVKDGLVYSGPIFTREFYIVSNKNKFQSTKMFNVSALYEQKVAGYAGTDIGEVLNRELNSEAKTLEEASAFDIVHTVNSQNGVDYAVVPADIMPGSFALTRFIIAAQYIEDYSGRIAVGKDLEGLIEALNSFSKINSTYIREACEEELKAIHSYLYKTLPAYEPAASEFYKNIREIIVYVAEDRYPLIYKDEKGDFTGILADTLQTFSSLSEIPLKYAPSVSKERLQTLAENLKDNEIVLNYVDFRKKSYKNADTMAGYFYDKLIVYGRQDSGNDWRKSKKIAVTEGSYAYSYLKSVGFDGMVPYPTRYAQFNALKKGLVDYALGLQLSYFEQLITGNYWVTKVETLPVTLPLDLFIYKRGSYIKNLFQRAMDGFIDYKSIVSSWQDRSDSNITNLITVYSENMKRQSRNQAILFSIVTILIVLALSMLIVLRARNARNRALEMTARAAESANKSKSRFLSNMSHEIRTPLNAILGLAQVTKRAGSPEKALEAMEQIESSGAHLLALVNDILDMSKIEAEKFTLSEDTFDFKECLREIIDMIKIKTDEKNQKFLIDFPKDAPRCFKGDRLRIRQILLNLLSNAVKFTPKNGTVEFSAKMGPEEKGEISVIFTVEDSGIGVSEDNAEKIFAPFEQGDSSISKSFGGTGLGLAISRRLANLMGGDISMKSQENSGSEFTFRVKLRVASEEEIKSQTGVSGSMENKQAEKAINVLIVDDMPLNRLVAASMLKAAGISTEEAESGKAAAEMFEKAPAGQYDVILMDVHMPDQNGYETTQIIRNSAKTDAKTVKIIALTASAFKEDVEDALKAGMDDHMAKPINMNVLIEKVLKLTE